MGGVDLVAAVELPVLDLEATSLELIPGPLREADLHHRVGAAVGDEDTGSLSIVQMRLPIVDDRDEPTEGKDPCHRRPIGSKGHRVAHHRSHGEATEHRSGGLDPGLVPEPVVQLGESGAGGMKGVVVGITNPRYQIPVIAGRTGEHKWPTRSDHMQPLPWIECVGEAEQVSLVRSAAMVEYQEAIWISVRRSLCLDQ